MEKAEEGVHTAMCDNIDTRRVLETLRELVVGSNAYIEKMRVGEPGVNRQLLKNVATYITRIFDTLGLIAKEESVGFPSSALGATDLETLIMLHLEALADFRVVMSQFVTHKMSRREFPRCTNSLGIIATTENFASQ